MRKYLVWLPVVLIALAGCATSAPKMETPKVTAPKYEIVDYKNSEFGTPAPQWVLKSQTQMEQDKDFSGNYVFRFEESGKSLDGVKVWAQGFSAQSEIAKIVKTRVQDKFVGAAAGDKDKVENYMEQVVKTLSDAEFTGYKKWDDYWVLKSFKDDKGKESRQEYTYIIIYTMPRDVLDTLIKDSLENANKADQPKSEDEKTVRDRVKAAFDTGI